MNADEIKVDVLVPSDFRWERDRALRKREDGSILTLYGLHEEIQTALVETYDLALTGQGELLRPSLIGLYRNWVMFADQAGLFPLPKLYETWRAARLLGIELNALEKRGGSPDAMFPSVQRKIMFDVKMSIVSYAQGVEPALKNHTGKGVMRMLSGKRYEGDFANGQIIRGTIVYPGEEYVAKLKSLHIPVGESRPKRYVGNIAGGSPQGAGRMENSDGRVLEGEFRNGGLVRGKCQMPDGTVLEGVFQAGRLHGDGKILFPGGRAVTGTFHKGQIVTGRIERRNGTTLVGDFVDGGKLHGVGEIIQTDGRVLRGPFDRGVFLGPVTVTHPNGRVSTVRMVDGKFVESG
jgi:hypothetical protein